MSEVPLYGAYLPPSCWSRRCFLLAACGVMRIGLSQQQPRASYFADSNTIASNFIDCTCVPDSHGLSKLHHVRPFAYPFEKGSIRARRVAHRFDQFLTWCGSGTTSLGYLAHKKTSTSLGTTQDPRHRPTVGS